MTYRALMVLRMKPEHANAVADLFARHDRGELPGIIGVSRRTLFRFHDLYMHLIEADTDVLGNLLAARSRHDFQQINAELDKYLQRYDPQSWRGLTDSLATPFYVWSSAAEPPHQRPGDRTNSPDANGELPVRRQPPIKIAKRDVAGSQRSGGEVRILLSPATVGATEGFMGTMTIEPGGFVAEHYNPYSDKFCYVVRGSVTIRVDGAEIELRPDEALMIRRGQRHRIENHGDRQAFLVFHVCPLAPIPELGHVDTEELPNPDDPLPRVGAVQVAAQRKEIRDAVHRAGS